MHDTKAIIINRPGSVTTSRRKLKQQVFLFVPLLPISSRFRMCLFCHSTLVRLRRGRSRRHSSSSSSRSLRLQPHHQCFDCHHGLLVLLLVLCDACPVCCCYTTRVIARVAGMYLLHSSSCRNHRAFLLWCVCVASPHHTRHLRCGSFTTTREGLPPSLVSVSPGTLLLRAASGWPGSPRSNSDTYRRTCHNAPWSLCVGHPGAGNHTFIK